MCMRSLKKRQAACAAGAGNMPPSHYRGFFVGAILIMLTAGVAWGTWFLVQISMAQKVTGVSLHVINAHGQTVIYGFLGLFIIGFAYQALPRLWQNPLVAPALCKPVLLLTVAGIGLLVAAELRAERAGAGAIAVAGGLAQTLAASLFIGQMLLTCRRGPAPLTASTAMVFAAFAFLLLHTPLNAIHTYNLVTTESKYEAIYYTSVYQPALRYLQFHGMTLLVIFGVASRLLPSFFAIPRPSERKLWTVLVLVTTATLAEAAIFVWFRLAEDHRIAMLLIMPWMILLGSSFALVWPWKLWRPLRDGVGRVERMGKFVRASFTWLIVSLAMTIAQPGWSHYVDTYFSHAWYGATRQAFAVGFATMMIIAFTLRVVPNLNGIFPNTLSPMRGVFVLINAGLLLHIGAQVGTDLDPRIACILPLAGVLQIAAIGIWASHLLLCIARGCRARGTTPEPAVRLQVLSQA